MQKFLFTVRKRSWGQGNIFTGVCLSTGRGVGFPACITCHMTGGSASRGVCLQGRGFASRGDMHPGGSASGVRSAFRGGSAYRGRGSASRGDLHPGGSPSRGVGETTPEIYGILWDTVNKWAVCILLECIQVRLNF